MLCVVIKTRSTKMYLNSLYLRGYPSRLSVKKLAHIDDTLNIIIEGTVLFRVNSKKVLEVIIDNK